MPLDCDIKIELDYEKIKEALVNLIDNAIKFTENGIIEIVCLESTHEIVISVKDTGEGINQVEANQIFNKFYQSEKNRCTGTGLGLYITKLIVEMHKGTISIDSKEGWGTKFTVTIPKNNRDMKVA